MSVEAGGYGRVFNISKARDFFSTSGWNVAVSLCYTQTYSVDKQVADSASTATAYHCGVKANAKTVGLSANAVAYECNTTFGNEVFSVLRRAKAQGKHMQQQGKLVGGPSNWKFSPSE